MRAGTVVVLAGLAVGLLVLFVVRRPRESPPPPSTGRPTSVFEGVELADWDPDGTRWRITADEGFGREGEATGQLRGVRAEFVRRGKTTRLTAARADVERGEALTLGGGVEITWDGYEAAVDEATYRRGSGTIRAPGPVSVHGPGVRVEGRGLEVDVEGKVARVLEKVHAVVGRGGP